MSSLAGAHLYLFEKIIGLLRTQGGEDISVIAGGIIPDQDVARLKAIGVRGVFPPGSSLEAILEWVRRNVQPR